MVNYQNTKIYKIESHLGPKIYIGSTTKEYLSQRMDTHRSDYKRWKNGNPNKTMSFELFEEYGVENCKIVLLETYPCIIYDERASREAYYIRTLECVNKVIPNRTPKEYYENNKDKFKQYREDNKDKIKQYREDTKEDKKQYNKQYYEDNKDKVNEQMSKYMICSCGKSIQRWNKSKHENTKIHIKYLETLSNQ